MKIHSRSSAAGFTLIEILIALVLSVMIISGLIAVMSGMKQSGSFNAALTEVQSNGRFIIDRISREVRMAGYQGCLDFNSTQLTSSIADGPTTNLQDTAVYASVIGTALWTPAAPLDYMPPNNITPVVGSHALIVQRAESQVFNLNSSMLSESDSISVGAPASHFAKNGLAMITNCETGDLFEIDSVSGTAGNVSLYPVDELSIAYRYNNGNPEAVQVMPFSADIYFIADTGRRDQQNVPVVSLFLQSWPYTAANPPQEIIEGVENMMTRFGHRTDDGNLLSLTPNAAALDPQKIVSVEVGLLLSSAENVTSLEDETTYLIAGYEIEAQAANGQPSATTHARTKRLRRTFNATIDVRNRR